MYWEDLKDVKERYLSIDIIKQRKTRYGDSFSEFKEEYESDWGEPTTTETAIKHFITMKRLRIKTQRLDLERMVSGTEEWTIAWRDLEDSYRDFANYSFILSHFDEYLEIQ